MQLTISMIDLSSIDPLQLLTVAGTLIGVAIGYFATNPRALRFLKVGQKFIDLGNAYFEGNADKQFTDEEYKEIGKAFVAIIKEVSVDESVPELELNGV